MSKPVSSKYFSHAMDKKSVLPRRGNKLTSKTLTRINDSTKDARSDHFLRKFRYKKDQSESWKDLIVYFHEETIGDPDIIK